MRIKVDFTCPSCGAETKELGATNPTDEETEPGSIIVCGNCGDVSQVISGALAPFSNFASLSPQEEKDLKFAIRAVKANIKRFRRK
jgi:predicted RNA-binding Zn-ribbon protein involved in translation (DUF1610 family)